MACSGCLGCLFHLWSLPLGRTPPGPSATVAPARGIVFVQGRCRHKKWQCPGERPVFLAVRLSKVRITQKFVVVCGCFEYARKVRAPTCDEAMEQKLGQAYLLDFVGLCIANCVGFQNGCRHVATSCKIGSWQISNSFLSSRHGTLTQQHSTSLVPAMWDLTKCCSTLCIRHVNQWPRMLGMGFGFEESKLCLEARQQAFPRFYLFSLCHAICSQSLFIPSTFSRRIWQCHAVPLYPRNYVTMGPFSLQLTSTTWKPVGNRSKFIAWEHKGFKLQKHKQILCVACRYMMFEHVLQL